MTHHKNYYKILAFIGSVLCAPMVMAQTLAPYPVPPAPPPAQAPRALSPPTNALIERITSFAESVAVAAFTYDHQNYQAHFAQVQPYFTLEGWRAFRNALAHSNNLTAVTQYQLSVDARLTGRAQIVSYQGTLGNIQWKVAVPLIVTYRTADNRILTQPMHAILTVVPTRDARNPEALAVKQFVGMPIPSSP